METEEERRAKVENGAARLERMVATAEVMLALIKDMVDVGVVLSFKPILNSWQLCLSFKFDFLTK